MADNINIKDAAAITRILRAKEISPGIWAPYHILLDSTGAEILGEKAKASSLPVCLPTDQQLLGRGIGNISDSFTRPADTTAYAVGDLVANSTVAGSVVPLTFSGATRFGAGGGVISRCRLFKSTVSLTNAQFRLYMFRTSPTPTIGDNASFNTASALATNNGTNYLGKFDITLDVSFSDGAHGSALPGNGADDIHFKLSSGTSLFALVEARAAYAPGNAEVFTAYLEGEQT